MDYINEEINSISLGCWDHHTFSGEVPLLTQKLLLPIGYCRRGLLVFVRFVLRSAVGLVGHQGSIDLLLRSDGEPSF